MCGQSFLFPPSVRALDSWKLSTAVLTAAAVVVGLSTGAVAKSERSKARVEAIADRKIGEPIMAVVSIKSQLVTFYDAEGWIARAPVSTGVKGRETPAGVFAVIEKDKDHHSSMYDDAWMPNMQRITWNGVALHGGPLPGYAASHGCVRMPYGFAEKFFDKTRIGMRVIISPNDAEPLDVTHPALPQPNASALAAAPARADKLQQEAAAAAKAADAEKKAAAAAARELASLKAAQRKLDGLKSSAQARLDSAKKSLAVARSDDAKSNASDLVQQAQAKVAEIETQQAKLAEDEKELTAAHGEKALKAAEAKKNETARAATDAKLALEPFSIFISRSTQKLYVRRNTHKPWADGGEVFDSSIEVPIKIKNPEKPLGTHIFTAMSRTGSGLRWTAVTIDSGDSAQDALERVTIPQDVLDRLAPTALPRSSIVISDEPLSSETNYRTEFVAVLSNHPQGGFITRQPPANNPAVARGKYRDDYDYDEPSRYSSRRMESRNVSSNQDFWSRPW